LTNSFDEKLQRIAAQRRQLEEEEAAMREEAVAELDRIREQIEVLEARREQLEALLGLDDAPQRAGHGQIQQLCISIVSERGGSLTSSQVRDFLEAENPGMKLTSVPSTLSRLVSQGRMRRDEAGRYFLA
jgi:hypothetical protein